MWFKCAMRVAWRGLYDANYSAINVNIVSDWLCRYRHNAHTLCSFRQRNHAPFEIVQRAESVSAAERWKTKRTNYAWRMIKFLWSARDATRGIKREVHTHTHMYVRRINTTSYAYRYEIWSIPPRRSFKYRFIDDAAMH